MTYNRWYIFKDGDKFKLGFINTNGDYMAAGMTYKFSASYEPVPLESADDILPINERFVLGFCKGVASEVLSLSNKSHPKYDYEYNITVKKMRSQNLRVSSPTSKVKTNGIFR